jgi:polysaccharide biosynthesis protein PslF
LADPSGRQRFSGTPSFGLRSTYPPTPCGPAAFSAALAHGLSTNGADFSVVRVSDGPPSPSVAGIEREYGSWAGIDGDEVVAIIDGLRVPPILIARAVLKDPTAHQRSVFKALTARADQ